MARKYYMRDALEKFKKRELYIGSGSGWLWIGAAIDAEWALKFLDGKIVNFYKKSLRESKKELRLINNMIPVLEHDLKKNGDRKLPQGITLEEKINRAKNRQVIVERKIKTISNYINPYKPLEDREIIRCYVREPAGHEEDRAIAIKLEGVESGKYWMRKEFQADLKNSRWLA